MSIEERLVREQNRCELMKFYCEAAERELTDAGNGSRHDPSWIRPKKMSRGEIECACIQAYHWIHKALEESKKP